MNIALLCSGNLGFKLLKFVNSKQMNIQCVLTDSKSLEIIRYAKENKFSLYIGNPRKGKAYNALGHLKIDVLLSINYLFLIEKDLIDWPKSIAVNIHGSLLPKYRGRTPHVWAIINGEEKAGITLHEISIGCDTGAIIEQLEITISPEMTGAELLKLYSDYYSKLVDKFFQQLTDSSVIKKTQDESKATYFGERTPDLGQINWNWSRFRIVNWIRAQSNPYPGAFSYIDNIKITIDKVKVSDKGFDYRMPNGMILSENPIMVKCPDGVMQILTIRNHQSIKSIKANKVFDI